jgi:hypothetical protein
MWYRIDPFASEAIVNPTVKNGERDIKKYDVRINR